MRKLTRRSYNRKLIMLGLALFLSVGLISTGFSAWLISSVNKAEATPPVTAGAISADNVTVTLDKWTPGEEPGTGTWSGDVLSFNASDTDTTGRVTYSNSDANTVAPEKLTMEIAGKVVGANKIKALTMAIDLPESIYNAIQANYISIVKKGGEVLVDAEDDESAIKFTEQENGDYRMEVALTPADTFSYTLTFAWGSYFGGVNPSRFYDGEQDGTTVPAAGTRPTDPASTVDGSKVADADVVTEMHRFHETLTGVATDAENGTNAPYEGTIKITVTPTLK